MAQQVKTLTTKAWKLNLILRIQVKVEGENLPHGAVLWPSHMCPHSRHVHVCAHTHNNNKTILKGSITTDKSRQCILLQDVRSYRQRESSTCIQIFLKFLHCLRETQDQMALDSSKVGTASKVIMRQFVQSLATKYHWSRCQTITKVDQDLCVFGHLRTHRFSSEDQDLVVHQVWVATCQGQRTIAKRLTKLSSLEVPHTWYTVSRSKDHS